jgi:4-hydroxybenzoate polyprenyltransferase
MQPKALFSQCFKRLDCLIQYLENPAIPFYYYPILFLSAVTVRNSLEFFSDRSRIPLVMVSFQRSEFLTVNSAFALSIVHFCLFWAALFLAAAIVFQLIVRKSYIGNVLRVVLSAGIILVITPVVDLLLSGGKGIDGRYINPKGVLDFLPIVHRGATPGMCTTMMCGLILSFLYCFIKTRSVKRGLLGFAGMYVLLITFGTLPWWLKAGHPLAIVRALSLIICGELGVIVYFASPAGFIAFVKDARFLRISHFVSMLFFGIILSRKPIVPIIFFQRDTVLLAMFAVFFAWLAAVVFNNIEDLPIDKVSNATRPTVAGSISLENYKTAGFIFVILALWLSFVVSLQTEFLIAVCLGVSFLYSLPPLRLKCIPVFSKMMIAFNSLIIVVIGYLFSGYELGQFPWIIGYYVIIFGGLALNFIDIKDYEGDKAAGILTLPVMLGLKVSKFLIGVFFAAAYLVLPMALADGRLFFVVWLPAGLTFFFLNRADYKEKPILIIYLVTVILLLLWLNR